MYEAFYGLEGRPFDLTPDPRFLLLTPRYREALAHVQYLLAGRAGLALLVGEAGTGKTTLLRAALELSPPGGEGVVRLDNPSLTRTEFFEFLADGFGLPIESVTSKTRVLRALTKVLTERRRKGITNALVVDEAQSLSDELLEEIRLLANVETPEAKLLSILLAGQPELAQRLNEPGLRQLKQRIALRAVLEPLTAVETGAYIAARLCVAGGALDATFTPEAVGAVHAHASGIPRTISVICENALITGFAVGARPIAREVVMEVCRDLDIRPILAETPAVATPVRARAAEAMPGTREDPGRRVPPEGWWAGVVRRLRFLDLVEFWKIGTAAKR
jgi:type II secretory pathway predicted ATPase ExeA